MTVEQFETVSLYVGITGLIFYMLFIMYKLARESKAGKFGSIVIFGVLGLGVLAFVIKEVIALFLDI
jgi:hypothetical protein